MDSSSSLARPGVLDAEFSKALPLRILLAEDNTVNQKLTVHILGKLGYACDIAQNGIEVLEALERRPYDLIFMDLQMPEMDGLETTRHILERTPAGKRPTIVAMTASAARTDREQCMAVGMDDFVAKPVRLEEFRAVVERWGRAKASSGVTRCEPAMPSDGSTACLDPDYIDEIRQMESGGQAGVLASMIDNFLCDSPGKLARLGQVLAEGNHLAAAGLAHDLRGSGGVFGALHLARLLTELETASRTDGTRTRDIFEQVRAEFDWVCAALAHIRLDEEPHTRLHAEL